MKDQILYLFDPLCGWCYGFSKTMLDFYEEYGKTYEFVAVPGGMVTGEQVGPISNMEEFISNAYQQVEQTTGATYGKAYLDGILRSKTTILDSEPPSRALLTFRSFFPDRAVEYAHALQKAHYHEGRDFNDETLYEGLAESFGLDPKVFMERYHDERMKQNVLQEFDWVKESGVQGFPTVVYRSGQKYYMLAHGYASLETLKTALEKAEKMVVTRKSL